MSRSVHARWASVAAGALAACSLAASLPGLATAAPAPAAIAARPTVEFVDGVVRGNLHVTGASGQTLRFVVSPGSNGGKLTMSATDPQGFTVLPYANWMDGAPKGTETFDVRVTAPKTGASIVARVSVNVNALAPADTPLAFTRKVEGHGGTPISVNFFPASGLTAGEQAPLVMQGAGLGAPGNTDPYQTYDMQSSSPGTGILRDGNYNVVTWDPRGEFASGGNVQLNSPFYEGRDVSAIITWAAESTPVTLNGAGDPAMGMVGGSYGGGIQLASASLDMRIDAIVPSTTWNSLVGSLQPDGRLNIAAASQLLAALTKSGVRLDPAIRQGLEQGVSTGSLSAATLVLLSTTDIGALLGTLQTPTLFWQSTSDSLFPLDEATISAQRILANPFGTPVKIGWFDGDSANDAVRQMIATYSLKWLDKYVSGVPIPDAFTPNFQWWDETGTRYVSDLYPFSPGFNQSEPLVATSKGGTLTITPKATKPPSRIDLPMTVPVDAQIVGSPVLTFTYRGTGKARAIYAGIVDAGNPALRPLPTLVPVTLDGKQHTVTLALSDIAYTGRPNSALTVTLRGYANGMTTGAPGQVTLSGIEVDMPVRA